MRNTRQLITATLLATATMGCASERASNPSATRPAAERTAPATQSAAGANPENATRPSELATVEERLSENPTRRVLKLSNGFTVILQQNKTAPVVAARIYIKAGSLTEQQYMGAGISHVLEHLVAGATSGKRGEDENTLLLQQIGNDSNAYTSEDHTCYFITTTAEKWPVALDLLVDWTTGANFTPQQFAREYQVVQRELEMDEAEAERTFYTHTATTRYLEHPARLPVIGFKPAFQKLTFEDARAYYQQMYVPDNMIISIAGDIDLDAAEKMVLEQVGHVRRKKVPAIALPEEPQVMIERRRVARADVKESRILWAFPTTSLFSDDLYATDVLANVLGGGESSLLVRKLRDEAGLVIAVSCDNDTPRYAQGTLEISALLAADKIPLAQKAMLDVLEGVIRDGVPADALERAKTAARASLVYGDQTAEQQASRNALDFLATGNIDFTESYTQHLQQVTAEQVKAAAAKFIRRERMLTTALLPLKARDPFAENARVAASVVQAEGAVRKTVLPNGLTVLITRNAAAPVVSFQLYTLGGLLAEDQNNNGIGAAMMELMTRGTDSRTHEQIADFLDRSGSSLRSESGNNAFSLSMDCLKDKAAESFDLFADVALHPKFADDEMERVRPQLMAAVEQATEDWFGEAMKFTRQEFYQASPYKRLSSGDIGVVSKVTARDLRAHYEKFFRDPRHTVLAISGDVEPEAAARWAGAFAAIPDNAPPLALQSTPAAPHRAIKHTEKESATVMLAYGPGATADSPDRYALTVLQTYLGGYTSSAGAILFDTLRGKGLVYVVQANNVPGAATGMFLIAALGEPENTDKIVATIEQIVADTKAGTFTDNALAVARDQAITGQRLSNQTIAEKGAARAIDETLGLGYQEETRFAEAIGKVTRADVIRVANKYLAAPTVVITTPTAK